MGGARTSPHVGQLDRRRVVFGLWALPALLRATVRRGADAAGEHAPGAQDTFYDVRSLRQDVRRGKARVRRHTTEQKTRSGRVGDKGARLRDRVSNAGYRVIRTIEQDWDVGRGSEHKEETALNVRVSAARAAGRLLERETLWRMVVTAQMERVAASRAHRKKSRARTSGHTKEVSMTPVVGRKARKNDSCIGPRDCRNAGWRRLVLHMCS
ncbi:hypothetical protein ERJ75_001378600 [Trypanosoma vivax]|nr:hypothetical protein ERJ75_001378600 [Trypanosoma vivax]